MRAAGMLGLRWLSRSLFISVGAIAAITTFAANAHAQAPAATWGKCPDPQLQFIEKLQCAVVQAPLDYRNVTPGTINLRIAREVVNPALPWLVGLSGGPGQAGVTTMAIYSQIDVLRKHFNFLFLDQRGTGESEALICSGLVSSTAGFDADALPEAIGNCPAQLGARRPFFTTREATQDIELLRSSLGLGKVVLLGASYGTKLALSYSRTFPNSVAGLLLDGVVDPAETDPFADAEAFAAIRGAIRNFCKQHCNGVTSRPIGELESLVTRLEKKPLKGNGLSLTGKREKVTVTANHLHSIAANGDFSQVLRYGLPSAVHALLRNGDSAALLRLTVLSNAIEDDLFSDPKQLSVARFLATNCEEDPLPWTRSTPTADRHQVALATASALPRSRFSPFTARTLLTSIPESCEMWPVEPQAPQLIAFPYPTVPTLIFQGTEDTRTPGSVSARVAAEIPGAKRVVLAGVGHGQAMGSECAQEQLMRFLDGARVSNCSLSPVGALLLSLSYNVPPTTFTFDGYPGLSKADGRTVRGVLLTLNDAQTMGLASDATGGKAPGLRSGHVAVKVTKKGVSLSLVNYSYIRGLRLSSPDIFGLIQGKAFTVTVSGASATPGVVTIRKDRLTARLGGRQISCRGLGREPRCRYVKAALAG